MERFRHAERSAKCPRPARVVRAQQLLMFSLFFPVLAARVRNLYFL